MPNEIKIAKSYVLHLEPEFDKKLQEEYVNYFKENGIPSKNKQGAVFDLCRSLPAYNKNDMGIRPEILELSYKTIEHTLGDINHERNQVIGSTMKSELIKKGENEPIIMRICAVFSKDRLRDNPYYYIDSISEQNGFSMEALFSDWEYFINGIILTRQEKPEITEEQVESLILNGESIYDKQGNRVILLLGTIDKPIEFKGFALIVDTAKPADPQSDKTYLEVASQKQNDENNVIKESEVDKMSFRVFETETDLNTYVVEIKNSYKSELKVDQLQADLQTANASNQELTNKLKTADETVANLTTRAETAEGELAKQAQAKLVEIRKQALTAKNYEIDEDDLQFIGNASEDDFIKFVKRIDKAQASVVKTNQATASQHNDQQHEAVGSLGIDLTGTGSNGNGTETKEESKKVEMNVFI